MKKVAHFAIITVFTTVQVFSPLVSLQADPIQPDSVTGQPMPVVPFQPETTPPASEPASQENTTTDFLNQSSPLSLAHAEPTGDEQPAKNGINLVQDEAYQSGWYGGVTINEEEHAQVFLPGGPPAESFGTSPLSPPVSLAHVSKLYLRIKGDNPALFGVALSEGINLLFQQPINITGEGWQTFELSIPDQLKDREVTAFSVSGSSNNPDIHLEISDVIFVTEEPPVPEGWTRAASNPNYAFRIKPTQFLSNYTLLLIDLRKPEEEILVGGGSQVRHLATIYDVSPDGKVVAVAYHESGPVVGQLSHISFYSLENLMSGNQTSLTGIQPANAKSIKFVDDYVIVTARVRGPNYNGGTNNETREQVYIGSLADILAGKPPVPAQTIISYGLGSVVKTELSNGNQKDEIVFLIQPGEVRLLSKTSREYDANGIVTRQVMETYHPNGKVNLSTETLYQNGKLSQSRSQNFDIDGVLMALRVNTYDTNGNLQALHYADYENGKLKRSGYVYFDSQGNLMNSVVSTYHSNGKLKTYDSYTYLNGDLSEHNHYEWDEVGIRTVRSWAGTGVAMSFVGLSNYAGNFATALFNRTPALSTARQAELWALYMEVLFSYQASYKGISAGLPANVLPSFSIGMLEGDVVKFQNLYPQISANLQFKGIEPTFKEPIAGALGTKYIEVGVKLNDLVETKAELQQREAAPLALLNTYLTENGKWQFSASAWNGDGVAMRTARVDSVTGFTPILFDQAPPLSRARQAEILAAYFEINAYASSLTASLFPNEFNNMGVLPAALYQAFGGDTAKVRDLFPEISTLLKSKGIEAYFKELPPNTSIADSVNRPSFNIGVRLEDPVNSVSEKNTRSQEPLNTYNTFLQTGTNVTQVAMINTHNSLSFPGFFKTLFNDSGLTEAQKIEILSGQIEYEVIKANYNTILLKATLGETAGKVPSAIFPIRDSDKAAFDRLYPQVVQQLKDHQTNLYQTYNSSQVTGGYSYTQSRTWLWESSSFRTMQIAGQMSNPPTTQQEFLAQTSGPNRSENIKAFQDYSNRVFGRII